MRYIYLVIVCACLQLQAQESNQHTAIALKILDYMRLNHSDSITPYLSDTVKKVLGQERLSAIWGQLTQQVGEFQRQSTPYHKTSADADIVVIPLTFEAQGLECVITFDANSLITGLRFVPRQPKVSYVNPPYGSSMQIAEIHPTLKSGKYELPAVLTVPNNGTLAPVIILVHGSGQNDMDETIGPNKPFKDLALGLGAKGIATFRYDKRTLVYATEMSRMKDSLTVEQEVIEDALSAIRLLKGRKEIDTNHIYLLGHSLGGMLAPRIGARARNQLAGIILLAGNARPLEDLMAEQFKYISSLDSTDHTNDLLQLKKQIPPSYWADLNKYNQVAVAASLKLPLLVLQGESDYQVTLQDFQLWQQGLKNKHNVQFISYPRLSHLFIDTGSNQKSKPSDYSKQGYVAEKVVEDIANWVSKNSK